MKCDKKDLLLYAVTDRHWLDGRKLIDVVRESLDGGVTMLQLREKALAEEKFLEEARELQALCRERHVPFIVNDNVDIAKAMDADGVHVGQDDMEALDVRAKLGPDKIIGVSAHTVEEALLAEKHGADYLGVGAVFPTSSKDDVDVLPYETLKAICEAVSIPVVAIGGISQENVAKLAGSGICGVAVISAIYAAKNIQAAAADLKKRHIGDAEGMIRGAIFDLDGVLLDSMGIWNDLGARYLRGQGITPEPGLNAILFAMSMEQGAAYLKAHYPLPQSEAEIGDGIARMLADYYFYEVPAKPGAAALLAFLAERNIPMAAATSSPRTHVTQALRRLGLLPYLKEIFTTGEVGVSKHQPDIYHLAAEQLGTRPAETLVFEDSLYALKTAAGAGYRTVGVFDASGEVDQAGLSAAADAYLMDLTAFPGCWDLLNK